MKPHAWEIEEIDGGPVGLGRFWICRVCGASGGPALGKGLQSPPWLPFLAGYAGQLSTDCDKAKEQIRYLQKIGAHPV